MEKEESGCARKTGREIRLIVALWTDSLLKSGQTAAV